jgi:hypothetical protein
MSISQVKIQLRLRHMTGWSRGPHERENPVPDLHK